MMIGKVQSNLPTLTLTEEKVKRSRFFRLSMSCSNAGRVLDEPAAGRSPRTRRERGVIEVADETAWKLGTSGSQGAFAEAQPRPQSCGRTSRRSNRTSRSCWRATLHGFGRCSRTHHRRRAPLPVRSARTRRRHLCVDQPARRRARGRSRPHRTGAVLPARRRAGCRAKRCRSSVAT